MSQSSLSFITCTYVGGPKSGERTEAPKVDGVVYQVRANTAQTYGSVDSSPWHVYVYDKERNCYDYRGLCSGPVDSAKQITDLLVDDE